MTDSQEGFCLKPGIALHLYVSTSPCGDARIFSPHEVQKDDENGHPNRKARGQLRTKIESGEGTNPVKSGILCRGGMGYYRERGCLLYPALTK